MDLKEVDIGGIKTGEGGVDGGEDGLAGETYVDIRMMGGLAIVAVRGGECTSLIDVVDCLVDVLKG